MSRKRAVLLWLLKLPLRPYLRWVSLALVLVLAVATLTGHLGLAARYAWGRWWPFGTPLVGYAPPDSRAFVLVNLTQPGAALFGQAALRGRLKARVDSLAEALEINPRWDLLQVMVAAGSPREGTLIVARGRFRPSAITGSLERRGYRAGALGEHPLFTHPETDEALLLVGSSLLLYGEEGALSRALERADGRMDSLDDVEAFDDWLDRLGRRHLLLALSVFPERQASLAELAGGGGAGLEAMAATVDAADGDALRFALTLGPRDPADVARLADALGGASERLRAGGQLVGTGEVTSLLATLQVERSERAVHAAASGTPAQVGALVDLLGDPRALATAAASLAAAGTAGTVLEALGLGSQPPAAPGAAQGGVGLVRDLVERLVMATRQGASAAAPPPVPSPPPSTAPAPPPSAPPQ